MTVIKDKIPYELATIMIILGTFSQSNIAEQHLLCELYMHEYVLYEERNFNLSPYVGDIQLWPFTSFVNN